MKKYSLLLLLIALFSFGARAAQTPVTLTSDGNGGWYINMPAIGTATSVDNAAVLTLTADDIAAGKYTFKVYDDGGQYGNYTDNYEGYLIITVPAGYTIKLNGRVYTETCCDYLKIYDGTTTSATLLGEYRDATLNNVRSTAESVLFHFHSDSSQVRWGFDITTTAFKENSLVYIDGVNGVYDYPVSSFSYSVKDIDGNVIDPANYTTSFTLNGNPVASVAAVGNYVMTVVGDNSHPGTIIKSFAVLSGNLSGAGTEVSPYLINNTTDWNTFAEHVSNGYTYADKYVRLENDITVTTMAGNSLANSFQGIFLGNDKTLTFNYTATENVCAPFRFIKNATISNLNVAGAISTGYKYGAGLAAAAIGTNTITDCVNTVAITSTFTTYTYGFHGGFTAIIMNGSTTNFTNCVFAGKLLGGNAYCNGGFTGPINGIVTINNCLFAPTEITMSTTNSYTFGNTYFSGTCNYNGAYHTTSCGSDASSIKVYSEQQTSFCKKEYTFNATDYYSKLNPVINVNESYTYTGSVIPVDFTVKYNNVTLTETTDYTYAITPSPVQAVDTYTLTITGQGNFAGTVTKNFEVIQVLSGQGTEEQPYIISNNDDWNIFVTNVNKGNNFSGKFIKLTGNITVTTMAGDANHTFNGTFDGDNKTMTLDITSTSSSISYVSPFRYVSGATFKKLNIAGQITSNGQNNSSLIGMISSNDVTIQNCTSTVQITCNRSDSYSGGFVGYTNRAVTFDHCVFAGKLLGETSHYNRGFIGNGTTYYMFNFTDCLFAPTEVTMNPLYSKTFTHTNSTYYNHFVRTYYTTAFGEPQGIHVVTSEPANDVYRQVTAADNNNYYAIVDITGVDDLYLYTGSVINITPVVKYGSTTLTAGTDYNATIRNSSNEVVDPSALTAVDEYTYTFVGAGDYAGTQVIAFRIINGESINGYVFETGTDAEGKYYIINNNTAFERLASCVASSDNITSSKRFKQTADITVTTMVGSYENRSFQGVYDGQDHTMTVELNTTTNECAPFRFIKNATIKHLNIAGTITTSASYAGGLAYKSYGTNNIQNCVNTVEINSTKPSIGECYHGGFISQNQGTELNISNCVFAGKLLGANAYGNGGFVGYNNGGINYTDCLFAPAEITMSESSSATFNRHGGNTFTRAYYLTQYGAAQGNHALAMAPSTVHKVVTICGYNCYIPCDVTGLDGLYQYTGSAIVITPVVTFYGETLTLGTDYTVAISPSNVIAIGDYTLTITGMGNYAGTLINNFRVRECADLDGYNFEAATDDEGNYYVIANEFDLERLAAYVNSNHNAEGKRFKQTANITMTVAHTSIGRNNEPKFFKGIFDGDGKTITNLHFQTAESYNGLFGYTYNATIKNVNVVDCDITGYYQTAGIVGYSSGTTVSNCTVSGTINKYNSPNNLAGIVGYNYNGTISDCVNHANINGYAYCGGITGDNVNGTVINCVSDGVVTGTAQQIGSLVARNNGGTLTNNYYPSGLGLTGGVGLSSGVIGYDQPGAEVMFTITEGNAATHIVTEPVKVYNATNYYCNNRNIELSYDLPAGKYFDKYTISAGLISNPYTMDGTHTMTGVNENVTITGSHTDKLNIASEAVTVYIGVIPYTGSVITVNPLVKRQDVTLVQGVDYTFTTDPATVQAAGDYTMTITGVGDYSGTRDVDFTVSVATEIHNAADWDAFAAAINAGTNCNGYYKLADDFNNTTAVTTTVGTTTHPFAGLFEGNGKTLNVSINETSTQGSAPFREIAGATIQNLTVSGSVTGISYASGLVGFTRSGVNYIDNCVVNTNVTCTTGSNRYIGGVVGNGLQATLNISNTVYTGTFTNSYYYAGGLLGWSEGSTLNITNCLVTGGKTNDEFHPIAIKRNTALMQVTVNGAFYTKNPTVSDVNNIAATGVKVYSGAQTAFCKKEYTFNETDYYSKEETVISNVDDIYEYTGSVIAVTPTITYAGTALTETTDYTYVIEPATVQAVGTYTMTITGAGGYAGAQSLQFHVVAGILPGSGTEADPYLIASTANWNIFATNINVGAYDYSGCYVRLTENITISTMAGIETCGFAGNFNGADHTITISFPDHSYTLAPGEHEGAQGIALFNYVGNGCNIHDLNVNGVIVTANKFAGSIIAYIRDGQSSSNRKYVTLTNCHSSVSITSTVDGDATSGGLVGTSRPYVNLTISHCIFDGAFISSTGKYISGMVGYQNYNGITNINDCLMNADVTGLTTYSPNFYTFCRYGGTVYFTRAYYITEFGSTQGRRVYASADVPATSLFGCITATDGNTYYTEVGIGNIDSSYSYTGNDISINPTVSIPNESVTFVKDTDYEVAITYNGNPVTVVNEIGDYVFTFSAKAGGKCLGTYTKNVNVYGSAPNSLTCTAYSTTSATFTWNNDLATEWVIEISQSSSFNTIDATQNVDVKTATFNGLIPETQYYARVKGMYDTSAGRWSSTLSFMSTNMIIVDKGSGTSYYAPIATGYKYSITQQIYTAEEIGRSGYILSVDYRISSASNCTRNLDIYMVNTEKSAYSSTTDWVTVTAGDKVYSGNVTLNGSGTWVSILLDNPFAYDNTKNLAILVKDNTSTATGSVYFYSPEIYAYRSLRLYGSTDIDPTDLSSCTANSNSTWRSNIRLRMGKAFTTAGDWDVATNWTPNGVPTASEDVSIIANTTIKSTVVADVNAIVIKDGKNITIEDGGQLKHNNAGVKVNVEKDINGYGTGNGNWYLIASPWESSIVALNNAENLIDATAADYDLFKFNYAAANEWQNYKQSHFSNMNNGVGYLYAHKTDETVTFKNNEVKRSVVAVEKNLDYTEYGTQTFNGWNLVGNPFVCNAYVNRPYYVINAEGTELEAVDAYSSTPIAPCTGIMVQATDVDQTIKFNREAPLTSANPDNIMIAVKTTERGVSDGDRAVVNFRENDNLEKFVLNDKNAKLYIPQDGNEFAIASMSEDVQMFSLNFKATTTRRYSVSIDANGDFSYLHLIDKITGDDVDMLLGDTYTFIASPRDNENRFIVKLRYNGANSNYSDDIFAYQNGNEVIVNGEGELQVFDVMGRMVMTQRINGVETISAPTTGVYIFKLNEKTQKIVVR